MKTSAENRRRTAAILRIHVGKALSQLGNKLPL